MKQIDVSTEVFARIWSLRKEGEETEDEILRRVLLGHFEVEAQNEIPARATGGDRPGVFDARNGIHFPEGFRINWRYKGQDHEAIAERNAWRLVGTSRLFASLNELTQFISDSPQNAWTAWKYFNLDGIPESIDSLRRGGLTITPDGEVKVYGKARGALGAIGEIKTGASLGNFIAGPNGPEYIE